MSHADDTTRRESPKTYFVDFADLEAKLSAQAEKRKRAPGRRRVIAAVEDEVKPVRRNVQDAARAVARWVAAVVEHEGDIDLDAVLDKCLRPSADAADVNYAALAEQINETLELQDELTAKRVQTAIMHLRKKREPSENAMGQPNVKQKLDSLHDRLEAGYQQLIAGETDPGAGIRRDVAVEVLGAVRRAAGRMIENDYGEGIPREIDVDELEGRFLDFVRDTVRDKQGDSLQHDLGRLLVTLCDYDGSADCDMRLVVDGSRVVHHLVGPGSLPGLMAQLNVLVAGRYLIGSELYVAELIRIGEDAAALHNDADTKSFMNYVRRLPEDSRVPSPTRVASYCHNNATTHILERLYTGELAEDVDMWLEKARWCFDQIAARDSGFELIKTTQVLFLLVEAKRSGDASPVEAHFKSLGRTKALDVLHALMRFDNSPDLVDAARKHAVAALPEIKHQLIYVR
jgi:hypothetical protein